jgi:hypothetical protein
MTTQYQPQTALQPSAVFPAQLARHVPPPQPQYMPAASPHVPGVIVMPNGESYYGHPPIIYAQPQPLGLDPQASRMVGQGAMMAGGGVLALGVGTGVAEVASAMAGLGTGTLVAVAALVAVTRIKGAPRRIVTTNNVREEHRQQITNVATGLFGRATGSNEASSSHTTSSTIN